MGKHNWKNLPLVSAGLVIVNCLVFLVCQLTGDRLTTMGMLSPWSVFVDGEVWRVFTAMFLHGDVQHIFSNMLILFFLGSMLEKEIGHLPLFIIYLLSGIGGNVASLYEKYARGSLHPWVQAVRCLVWMGCSWLWYCFPQNAGRLLPFPE